MLERPRRSVQPHLSSWAIMSMWPGGVITLRMVIMKFCLVSTDGGASFSDKVNLSNTNDSESERVELDSEGESVIVTWWETNETDEIPIMRVSNDNGETFGPILRLGANGTIGEENEE
jgi:hypothetical protein